MPHHAHTLLYTQLNIPGCLTKPGKQAILSKTSIQPSHSPVRRSVMTKKVDLEIKAMPMTTREAGRKGGTTVRDRYGEDYYRRIGRIGGTALKDKRGSDYYRDIAKKGGKANMTKYGPDHFAAMGKKGGNTTKERHSPDFYSRIGKLGGAAKRGKRELSSK